MKNSKLILTLFLIFSCSQLGAQLKRQGSWGFLPQDLNDSIAEAKMMKDASGVAVGRVVPGGTSEAIGMEAGDVLLSINDRLVKNRGSLTVLREFREGDKVEVKVWRKGKAKTLKGKVVPRPLEEVSGAEVRYGAVPFKGGNLRSISTIPNDGKAKHPTIFFVPGYNCASYDNMSPLHPYRKLLDSLVHLGYALYRVEKPGMGDCQGTPDCFDIDFHTEQEAWNAGYEDMQKQAFVDPDQVFVLGHSMGGVAAPLLAQKFSPKGVIVYGTVHYAWSEYLMRMVRFQNPRFGVDYVESEKDMPVYRRLLFEHYVEKKPLKEIAKNEAYKRLLERDFQYTGGDMLFQRHETFWQDLEDLNLVEAWAETESKVLSVYGEADIEALNSDSHEEIARIVNTYHPGNATYELLEGTSHSFLKVGTAEEGVRIQQEGRMREYLENHFNYEIVSLIDDWIKGL